MGTYTTESVTTYKVNRDYSSIVIAHNPTNNQVVITTYTLSGEKAEEIQLDNLDYKEIGTLETIFSDIYRAQLLHDEGF